MTGRLGYGFPEALPAVVDGAPRTGTISMLAGVELRRNADGLSCTELARRLRRRRADVVAVLEDEPRRFTRSGSTKNARWTLTRPHGTGRGHLDNAVIESCIQPWNSSCGESGTSRPGRRPGPGSAPGPRSTAPPGGTRPAP